MAKNNTITDKSQKNGAATTTEETKKVATDKTDKTIPAPNPTAAPAKKKNFSRFILKFFILLLIGFSAFLWYERQNAVKDGEKLAARLTADYTQKYNELSRRLQQQEKNIAALQKVNNSVTENSFSEDEYNRLYDGLKENLTAYINSLPQKNNSSSPTPAFTAQPTDLPNEVLLASGAMIVRGLADGGQNFAYETEVLQILAQGNTPALQYIDSIKKFSASGIKNPSALIRTFNRIYADFSRPRPRIETVSDTPQNFMDSLKKHLQRLVSVKKRQPKPRLILPQNPDTVHELVNTGRFAEALNEINTDAKYRDLNSKELSAWIEQVQNYLEFDRAVNGLIMNSLANIRLKELHHNVAD